MKHTLEFYKYQGAGNDFILIDNREGSVHLTQGDIAKLCDRHRGIGSDGLMLLGSDEGYDFRMTFYNPDGSEASMCGNGARCITLFAHHLGVGGESKRFIASDTEHVAKIIGDSSVSVKLIDIQKLKRESDTRVFMNSGVPHLVILVSDIDEVDIKAEGSRWRYSEEYKNEGGTNVNFIDVKSGSLRLRTYERGVEGETLACGTGATASVVAAHVLGLVKENSNKIIAKGGELTVSFSRDYTDVWLEGEALKVFEGQVKI